MGNFKLKALFFLIVAFLVISSGFAFAQRNLEVPLPGLGETKLPLLPNYVKYIFNFAIGLGGLIAFLVLIYGGVRYLTSAGNPAATGDAKDRIFSAVLGIILLLGSWLILTTINPQLVIINPQLESPGLTTGNLPGVYLCEDAASLTNGPDCQFLAKSSSELGALDNKVKNVKFINTADSQYGVVLHGNKSFAGNCAICISGNCSTEISNISGVSSVTLFTQEKPTAPSQGSGATLYECSNYDTNSKTGGVLGLGSHQCQSWGPFQNGLTNIGQKGRSIKIEESRKYLAALFEGTNGIGQCWVFTQSVPNLATGIFGSTMRPFGSVRVMPIDFPL